MCLAVYVVSIPLDDKNEPKDEISDDVLNGLPLIDQENPEHKLQKRLNVITSSHAFVERNKVKHFEKRDSASKTPTDIKVKRSRRDLSQPPTAPQPDRKSRDTSKQNDEPPTNKKDNKQRIARDTTKEDKPKRLERDISDPNPNDPTTRKQPEKPIPVQKRDTQTDGKSDSNKHTDTTDDDKHTLKVRSADEKKVPEIPAPKPTAKREVKDDKDSKPQAEDPKVQSKHKKVLDE